MSFDAVNWAWKVPDGGPAQLLVLICLADHANAHRDKSLMTPDGPIPHRGDIVWLTIADLMSKTKLARRTVIQALRDNERAGYIRNHGPQPPWSRSTVYELANRPATANATTTPDANHATEQRHGKQPQPGPATATPATDKASQQASDQRPASTGQRHRYGQAPSPYGPDIAALTDVASRLNRAMG